VLRNLRIFAKLCGQKAMPNVVLVTTMWDKVDKEEGKQREEELMNEFWKDIVADGSRTARFERTFESAWDIVGSILDKNSGTVLLAQEEMGSVGKPFHKTKAGSDARRSAPEMSEGLIAKLRKWFSR
jgi:hypothetical protein